MSYTTSDYLRDVLASGTPNERAVAQTALKMMTDSAPSQAPIRNDMTAMVDAAMAEMSNIHPPLRRSECEPLDMVLHCPKCHTQHVDEPDERTPGWVNPPHRSHLCHACGAIWRPADVPTNGVRGVKTRGKADTWPDGVLGTLNEQPKEPK